MQSNFSHLDKQNHPTNRRAALTLLSAMLIIAGLWGVMLPRIADLPAMREKIQRLDRKGIDPNAFFYTDHPATFQDIP